MKSLPPTTSRPPPDATTRPTGRLHDPKRQPLSRRRPAPAARPPIWSRPDPLFDSLRAELGL